MSFADFEPTDEERALIFRFVDDLKRERGHESPVFDGVIYQLSGTDHSPRYLLVLSDDPSRELLLHVLQPSESDPISPVFPTGVIYNEFNFEPLAVADFDGDGLGDFAYCSWSDEVAEADRTVVGFSSQSWYRIAEFESSPPECGPGSSP